MPLPVKLDRVCSPWPGHGVLTLVTLLWTTLCAVPAGGQAGTAVISSAEAQALVQHALASELIAAQDQDHPMRFRLRKSSPRLTTTKDILETKDGMVARMVALNDKPLSQADEQTEQARLDDLVRDPGKQSRRKQREDDDAAHALKVLRALPKAFVYQYAGSAAGPSGAIEKFTFSPNPRFNPPDIESLALTEMSGELWIDSAHQRVTRLEGHLQQDADFGWGILGRLNKGGWVRIEQADVGAGQWRIVRFKMVMSGRVLFKTKVFDTTEEQTDFQPLPVGLGYQKAIQMLRATPGGVTQAQE